MARPVFSAAPSVGVEPNAYSSAVQLGGKALVPHDASKESYDAYVEKLDRYQAELVVLEIPLPGRVYEGLLDKARLEEQSYHQHSQDGLMSPQERRRAQIITLLQELVAEELNRSGDDPAQERRVEALYAILRDKNVDVDKLRERLVSGQRISSPVFVTHPPSAEHYDIGEITPVSGTASFQPVPQFPPRELLA